MFSTEGLTVFQEEEYKCTIPGRHRITQSLSENFRSFDSRNAQRVKLYGLEAPVPWRLSFKASTLSFETANGFCACMDVNEENILCMGSCDLAPKPVHTIDHALLENGHVLVDVQRCVDLGLAIAE